jgi:Domain of unknown function (DUF1942)
LSNGCGMVIASTVEQYADAGFDTDSAGTARGGTSSQPKGRVKVEIKKLAAAVAATTVVFSVGAVAPAWAADQVFGLEQRVSDPNGGEIAYTVTKFRPSSDALPYPVSGQLYEVTVRADQINGLVTPVIPAFSARSESGQNYPALANVWTPQGLSGATLLPGGHSSGKIYFDAVGDPPTSVVYNGAGDTLTWIQPSGISPAEVAPPASGGNGGGESAEGGGSTGPNQASPQTTADAGEPSGITGSDAGGGGLGEAPGASGDGGGLGGAGGGG